MPFLAFLRANAPFLLAGLLLSFLASFGLTYFIAPFAGDIRAAYGLGHGEWATQYAGATIAAALAMIWAGSLLDRYRVRLIAPIVLIGLAGALVAMALSTSVLMLPVIIFFLRFLGQGMAVQAAGVAMSRWFVGSRGRALAVAAMGYSLGEVILPIGFTAAKEVMPWRWLFVLAAGIILVFLPLLHRLLRLERTPQQMSVGEDSAGFDGRHWTRGQVLRHGLFWCLLPALLVPSSFITILFFHQVQIAAAKGWSHLGFLAVFPAYTVAAVVGMFASGAVLDRIGTRPMIPVYLLPMAACLFLFPQVTSLAWAIPPLALMGLTAGAQATVLMAFWAEIYGTRHLGGIRALTGALMVAGTALGPMVAGALIDRGIAVEQQMPLQGWLTLIAAGLATLGLFRYAGGIAVRRP
ncbi:MAG: MFS transporter [Rhodobacteraceae bacterium]|jgi:MFS family permease|nr:MFS transporter [Paracoccaceae bacterium]